MYNPLLFQQKYRVSSARMEGWNYTWPGTYFVTICTKYKEPWFGECKNGFVCLSEVGVVVHDYWMAISDHFKHVSVDDAWIVMPDHVHGIIRLHERDSVETCDSHVSTIVPNQIMCPSPGSLGSIINQYKSVCTKQIRMRGYTDFSWQPRYYDRVIRDASEYDRVRSYILNNARSYFYDQIAE